MKTLPASYLPLILGVIVLGIPACSKKAVRSGGDSQALQEEMARGAKGGAAKEGTNSSFPDTSFSGREDSNSLRGLDRNPSEERLGGNAGQAGAPGGGHANAMIAKADSGAAARQLAEIRAEQVASVAAGLRDVFFTYDSFSITDEGRHALSGDAEWARSNPYTQLKIEGHCDERGTSAYNLVLGEKRAKAVRNYLVELGVAPVHLSVVSYGKERPFCTEHTESCYSQNRRGHLVVKTGK
ncbi:MAG TPA: peptidoglycan-associated lipoprotein Pal [Nitrospira sp.]|nr:peptidoglycan-associated lipoprotein Pal [Nitrospira sp.]